MIDLTKFTDPTRNASWWTKERFYLEPHQPTVKWKLQCGPFRVLWWRPRFFLSVTFGSWQAYCGWGKCDATRTFALWRGDYGEVRHDYILTWTFAEMFALRHRTHLDTIPVWSNMGGA